MCLPDYATKIIWPKRFGSYLPNIHNELNFPNNSIIIHDLQRDSWEEEVASLYLGL